MKIAYFIDSLDEGGAETVVVGLASGMRARGVETEVHHLGNAFVEDRCRALGVGTLVVPFSETYRSAKTLPLFCFRYRRLLLGRGVDVLHTHLLGAVGAGALATMFSRMGHVGTLHDLYSLEENPRYLPLLKLAARGRSTLVTVARRIETFLTARGNFPSLVTIHNGVELSTDLPDTGVRGELGIADGSTVITSVGRLVPVKQFELLLEAFAVLPASAHLVIVGDGPERKKLEERARSLRIEGSVSFLGFRTDVQRVLCASDIFALSSLSEGLSRSILEAMAAALPIVCTSVGGNAELVTHGESGLLVPSSDSGAFAEALRSLVTDVTLRTKFGQASLNAVRERFSHDAMLDAYQRLYISALN